ERGCVVLDQPQRAPNLRAAAGLRHSRAPPGQLEEVMRDENRFAPALLELRRKPVSVDSQKLSVAPRLASGGLADGGQPEWNGWFNCGPGAANAGRVALAAAFGGAESQHKGGCWLGGFAVGKSRRTIGRVFPAPEICWREACGPG